MTVHAQHLPHDTADVDAPPIHPRVLQWALATAVVLVVGIAGASFWLSFAALRELAIMGGTGHAQAWVIPIVLDGAIVSLTVTAIALSNHVDKRTVRGRRFVTLLLRVAAAASIAGNSYHAVLSATLLPAVVSAGIAPLAPISLLLMTEVLAIILRAPRRAHCERSPSDVDVGADEEVASRPEVELEYAEESESSPTPPVMLPIPEMDDDVDVLSSEVRDTVRLRRAHPEWSWARIGQETDGVVASTAMRRFRKWEENAFDSAVEAAR
ncbi:DUF2637 domain-containing protein [Rhodococcoides kyotonense]|uniref:DUF2637 domain-containing protein n=1 Tax=Rhodococcoides kyotonense TaxID=398843 RepID=A0A239M5P9_9NOCA|nr:DUF2637 domain-containing protein [Rhodococcus kyotonensis]SNT37169.1 Protein of unknown function [Rhodococcus kyotonensis]